MATRPPIGSIIHLANHMIHATITAASTMADSPNMYGAELDIMGDGVLNTDGLVGSPGPDGMVKFALRRQHYPVVNKPSELPNDLNNNREDIGKYWLLDTLDEEGTVIEQVAWTWFGSSYRKIAMGVDGPPGSVPKIRPHVKLIDPGEQAYVTTSGTGANPSWYFHLPIRQGAPGPVRPLRDFPDFIPGKNIPEPSAIAFTGDFTDEGESAWAPMSVLPYVPKYFSVPQSSFTPYRGVSTQRTAIGSYTLPAQPWDWTPVVWGHLGGPRKLGEGGPSFTLSSRPMMIGCEVLLGGPKPGEGGLLIAKGRGNAVGLVNIMPHYSTANVKTRAISPVNKYATIPAGHKDPTESTIYVNLYNEGAVGVYNFLPDNAQLFILAVPIEPFQYTPIDRRGGIRR